MSRIAAIQMASGSNVGANLLESDKLISRAVADGAQLVVLPENFALMGMKEADKVKISEQPGNGQIQNFLQDQANRHGIWIVGGTVPVASPDNNKVFARCPLYSDKGELVVSYDKIHLFDVRITENSEEYKESETIEAGNSIVVVDTPFGRLGMVICYDLRFPGLFNALQQQQADFITLPAAFTAITGKAHWEILVRARAIESLSYIVASAQGGYHVNGRETYGDSMIVDPWGNILDRLQRGSGYVIANIDLEKQKEIRRTFPVPQHRKFNCSL